MPRLSILDLSMVLFTATAFARKEQSQAMENPETSVVKIPPLVGQHLFLDKVLCDGRYLDDFQARPEEVADLLCVPITPVMANEISTTPLNQFLPSLDQAKFGLQVPQRRSPIVILIIVVVIAVVIVLVIRRVAAGALIRDHSPYKDLKL